MKILAVGVGAAGNGATIKLLKNKLVTEEDVLLINSTLKDIPEDYRKLAVELVGANGSGKERDLSKSLCLNSIQNGTLDKLDSMIKDETQLVVLVASSEGGTGSGSMPVLAKYLRDVIDIPVVCFIFTGFEDDVRALANTVEIFQEMEDVFTVQAISNKKFLEQTTNRLKAEDLANEEFAKRVSVILEQGIVDSIQNIDETDLTKVITTPGFMTIGKCELSKLKNLEQFNKMVTDMIDEDASLETTKSVKRLAVYVNAPETAHDFIDFGFNVVKNKLGVPYEMFMHIQDNPDVNGFVSFIASGMDMPLDEVKTVYDKYKTESEKVNKTKDSFFSFASDLRGNQEDNMFNTGMRTSNRKPKERDKSAFLTSMATNNTSNINEIDITEDTNIKDVVKVNKKEEYLKNNF